MKGVPCDKNSIFVMEKSIGLRKTIRMEKSMYAALSANCFFSGLPILAARIGRKKVERLLMTDKRSKGVFPNRGISRWEAGKNSNWFSDFHGLPIKVEPSSR